MDFDDFLIEYDLTPVQLQLANRLKAEANLRQLLNVLGDHALFFSRRPRPPVDNAKRREVIAWFSSLSVEERMATLTCHDEGWVQAALKMSRQGNSSPQCAGGHFKVSLKPASSSRATRRQAREVKVQYRRPHRLPDGEVLAPPATPAFRRAAGRLELELRAFRAAVCVVASPFLVEDTEAFVRLLDEVSLGRFLEQEPVKSLTPWQEAAWLGQWGSHFPLGAFLASRLEVLLLEGFASRQVADPPPILARAEVWASMPVEQQQLSLARLGRLLFRRLLAESAKASQDPDALPLCLSGLLDVKEALEWPKAKPLELIYAASTAPLHEDLEAEVTSPKAWLHQQLAAELAVLCSEWSAALLSKNLEQDALRSQPRLSKKQKQKLRRRKLEAQLEAEGKEVKDEPLEAPEEEPLPFAGIEDFDWRSERSSACPNTTTSSVCDCLHPTAVQYALMQRSFWDAELRQALAARAAAQRCHEDSRLEFLLRNRDRIAELDWDHWDHLSQGSMPASLDEGALYPVGLESRFAYLFDSPARSHVTTALASQATAEDDVELRAQWEDENLVEWQDLSEALEKSEAEKEMWRCKAAELEGLLQQPGPSLSGVATPPNGPTGPGPGPDEDRSEERERRRRPSLGAEDVPARRKWRYLVLLLLARQQLDIRDAKDAKHRESPPVEEAVHEAVQVAAWAQVETRLARAVSLDLADSPAPAELRKRALVTFNARVKGGRCCDAATQTAPAITLSKMYGGIVPHYVQRELARLRQENQLLRYRIASLAMSQPQRSPVRHQATQTAPALTFSTGRVGGHSAVSMTRLPRSTHQVPAAAFEAPPELQLLEASIVAFVRSVEVQTESQASYRRAVIANCKRVAQAVWPRCSLELYGSYASGLGLSSGLDLLLKVHPSHGFSVAEPAEEQVLSPIDEDEEQLRQRNLEEVSPAHSARVRGTHSGWQQQLSDRLAKEKWVVSDSIRVAAHAAIPVLSFAAAPEVKRVSSESEQFMPCSTRVDICLHDAGHRGLRSKALINFLLNRYPLARPVTLVLKQWLIEQAYSMSHSGGLCSYGLLLMVIAYLQYRPANTAATALVGFLNFYGRRFDPQLYGVSVARAAFLPRKSPMSWPPEQAELVERGLTARSKDAGEEAHRFDPLLVEDPVNPTNNVGRNCFRIRQIQRSLARAADMLESNEAGTLRAILRADGPPEADGWRVSMAKHDLHEDLYLSLVEHGNRQLMLPISAQGRMARSHLPQQWDSVVRYAETAGRMPGPAGRF